MLITSLVQCHSLRPDERKDVCKLGALSCVSSQGSCETKVIQPTSLHNGEPGESMYHRERKLNLNP